ncbi:hypothetical protein ACG3JJ_01125 [Streptococcus parauberis]|uniref:hypothetical protein n=1 Tax=Streptococcus parauberis TaxID=1348 RepID=UPI0002EF328C|nr:hypothetical protein [Streptococcus parauberis]QBX27429.1 hypothetical protein Javan386_0030 [Streptococcus phage Javan386]UWM90924.1 hypothetical protein N2A94_10620 [Streptococcus parauberis]
MSLNKTRKRSIEKSKRDLQRHNKKKIEKATKQIALAIGYSNSIARSLFNNFAEAFNDKK